MLNAELVQRLLQAKEDMRDTLQAAERLTLAYSDSAASLTFLTAQKKTLQKDLHAAEMKVDRVGFMTLGDGRSVSANFEWLVLGCIETEFCKKIFVGKTLDEIYKFFMFLQRSYLNISAIIRRKL